VPSNPITFKSGLVSPVYIDNRRLPFYPEAWQVVIEGFKQTIANLQVTFDCLAGIESAGIPHSATLGFVLAKPSVFTRKQAKDHGTKKMVEGGEVKDKIVLLIEDHVTTGGSSLAGVKALREAGAVVQDCLAITSYGFKEAVTNFKKEKVRLHTLTTFAQILPLAVKQGLLSEEERRVVEEWLSDPWEWGADL